MLQQRASESFPHVPYYTFEEYSERFKDFFQMRRENGIIEVRMHTDGDSAIWSYGVHNGWGRLIKMIGQDPQNEVLILGGAGDKWIAGVEMEYAKYTMNCALNDRTEYARSTYDHQYRDGLDLIFPLLYDIHIPTIAVINGVSPAHVEFPLICDITLAAPDAVFAEEHFSRLGTPTGDGLYLVLRELFGYKVANSMTFLGKQLSADEALAAGVLTEVLPREKLYDRAWEIAQSLMNKDRYGRRLQHEVATQRWRQIVTSDFNFQFMCEEWGNTLTCAESLKAAAGILEEVGRK